MVNRPYQNRAVLAVEKSFETRQSALIVMPTGTGKSRVFSDLVLRKQPQRSLVLAHRSELIWQAVKNVGQTGLPTSVEKAELFADTDLFNRTSIVIASVQTLVSGKGDKKRMHRWKPDDFGLVVCDEGHHYTAPMFRSVLDYFRQNQKLKIFGCTASPKRADDQALGMVFEECVFTYTIGDAIREGWLVPVKAVGLEIEDMDFSGIKTSDGDLSTPELAAVMEREKPLYGVVQAGLEAAFYMEANALHGVPRERWYDFLMDNKNPPRSTLFFGANVQHAMMQSELLNRIVPGSADFVCGKTEPKHREQLIARFRNGDLPFLTNCGVMTEGVDVPRAQVIVPKPTKSHALAIQMYGRGLRPPEVDGRSIVDQYATEGERRGAIAHSRKPCCTIIDLYGVTGRHKMVLSADILGGDYSEDEIQLAKSNQVVAGKPVDMTAELEKARDQIRKKQEEERQRAAAKRAKIFVPAKFAIAAVDPFDEHSSAAMIMPKIKLTGADLSAKQRAIIVNKLGKDPDKLPIGYAKKLIGDYFVKFRR